MNKKIYRNVAAVTAIFAITLSIMLATNYFQVRKATPLQTEVAETLKELNDMNSENPQLQEQIRQLDLLSRKAYFIGENHLKTGIYLLLAMIGVLIAALRLYFNDVKNIPDKDLDPFDDWLLKSKSRGYILWGSGAVAATALVLAFLSSPYYTSFKQKKDKAASEEMVAEAVVPEEELSTEDEYALAGITREEDTSAAADTTATEATEAKEGEAAAADSTAEAGPAEPEIPKVTHNGFRGNNSNGQSSARNIPTSWNLSAGTNIAWKTSIPKPGYNSPAISGRNVFVSGADAEARELYCYDIFTGEMKWKLAASGIPGSPSTMPAVNADTGLSASSVATNGQQVCAIFATGDIICADMDGNKLWAKNLGVPDNHYGFASSLLIYGSEVIVQYDNDSNGRIIALNLSNGNQRWMKERTEKATWSSPTIAYVDRKAQLIVMGNPNITAYDPNNGDLIWKVDCMSGEVGASPAASNGKIFGANEYAALVAINGTDGALLWQSNEYLPEVSSPVASRDWVYVATSYGVLASFNAETGELVAEQDLGCQFYSSPMIVDGKLFIFSIEGTLYMFSNNGQLTLLGSIPTGENTYATPAFTDGRMVVRSQNSLYCVSSL
ncbi:MAG: PQQ-binding-like beta-propeller repeat protein [Bacteroidales bacterium]|nr:PQQ-binding-like beta-propeller repeat protein [Bacteroidales bacterium]